MINRDCQSTKFWSLKYITGEKGSQALVVTTQKWITYCRATMGLCYNSEMENLLQSYKGASVADQPPQPKVIQRKTRSGKYKRWLL